MRHGASAAACVRAFVRARACVPACLCVAAKDKKMNPPVGGPAGRRLLNFNEARATVEKLELQVEAD